MTKYLDAKVTCTADVGDPGDEEDWIRPCGKPSRFAVARSDGDSSFGANGGSEEACEEHVADAVLGMVGGDETVSAVITIRWGALDDATTAGGAGPRGASFSNGPGGPKWEAGVPKPVTHWDFTEGRPYE